MPKIVVYQTASVWFVKNEYFMAKIDVCRSLLPSDRVIGRDIKITSHPNSNATFINILDRLIWRRSPNLTRSSKLAAAPNCSFGLPYTWYAQWIIQKSVNWFFFRPQSFITLFVPAPIWIKRTCCWNLSVGTVKYNNIIQNICHEQNQSWAVNTHIDKSS